MATITDIVARAKEYMPDENLAPIARAHAFAGEVYAGHHRLSGSPYLQHAMAVAYLLASMRLDVPTICAGLLHGVLKQAEPRVSEAKLREEFGDDIASIVSGATKITSVQFNSQVAYQAENIRKMLLAMSTDIRVLLVKLADRLHDMQSLRHVSPAKQVEFAQETMELYAPLASRLGIDWIKRELEDLSFSYLHPTEFARLSQNIQTALPDREAYVEEIKALLSHHLIENGIAHFRILGRPKHLYSIYKKLLAQNIPIEKVYDKVAFRIIVPELKECYEVLGIIHSIWAPIDGRFKDFISHPKTNGYKSLHTSVVGPHGDFMEIQIRTEEMDRIAQEGIAAHWAYKEGRAVTTKDVKLFKWLKQLVQTLQELEDPKEFLDAVKGELYEDDIYVLTPTGEVRGFPRGSTPLDFAYSIHTEVGNRCAGARISGQIAQLKTELKNGDVVEIITAPGQNPHRGWLALVKTARAKSRIKQWLNQEEREKSLTVGRELCERELRKHNLSLKKFIKTGHLKEVLKSLSCNSLDDLMRKVGSGKVTMPTIIRLLQPAELREEEAENIAAVMEQLPAKRLHGKGRRDEVIVVDGADGVLTKISHCCMPVPGDAIGGFITAGRGISVHKTNCHNLLASDPERRIAVSWATTLDSTHRTPVQVIAQDQRGLLAAISNAIGNDDADIVNLEATTMAGGLARINVIVEVKGVDHLVRILQHLQQLAGVIEAKRK